MGTKDATAKDQPTKAEVKSVDTDNTYDPVAENAEIAKERAELEQESLDKVADTGRSDAAVGLDTDQTEPSAPSKPTHENPTP